MAPFFHIPRSTEVTATPYGAEAESDEHHNGNGMKWIIPVIVAGGIIVAALAVCGFILFSKRSQYRQARQRDPYLTRGEFDKRRKMSAAERLEEEERQRIIMIRKSLASRSWDSGESSSSRRVSQISSVNQSTQAEVPIIVEDLEEEEEEGEEGHNQTREDWKAYEARIQQSASPPLNQHPAADAIPNLAVPRPSRSRSPSRSPLLRQLPSTPPIHSLDFNRQTP